MFEPVNTITAYAWLGWCITTAVLGLLWYLTGLLGVMAFKRLRRVYHLSVIGYWLHRLEQQGLRVFEKAEAESIAATGSKTP